MKKKKVGEGEFETVKGKWLARTIWQKWDENYDEGTGQEFIIVGGRRQFRGKTRQTSSQFGKNYYLKHHWRV